MQLRLRFSIRATSLLYAAFNASLAAVFAYGLTESAYADDLTGEQIFAQKCATCHGAKGEGVQDHFPDPLIGDKHVSELAKLIDETMPEGAPEELDAEGSAKVAAFIYDAFYSPIAQARNRPARIDLSRLTARQYQNAVSDLIGSFGSEVKWDDKRGLEAEYYESRRTRRDKRVIERTDPQVSFNFKDASPDKEKIKPEEFSIRWEGGILATDTGDYEFVVETENGARLWVNDDDQPLIDAGVKSGSETRFKAAIRLLGGRVYPIRLEFYKAKEPTSSISLKWKPPHQVEHVVPERNLSPNEFPERFVLQTSLPADDRSTGYERGTSISKAWAQATTQAGLEVAAHVANNLRQLADAKEDASDRDQRIRDFCRKFVERAFRRPLTDEQKAFFVDRQFEGAPADTAVKRVILLALKSPRFLYRETAQDAFDAYDMASWLAFGLWDSVPDQQLLDAAASGNLTTREQLAAHADRMIADLRARSKLREFLHQWLRVDQFPEPTKDTAVFPGFDEEIISDLRSSLDLFLEDVVWSEASDFRQLLLTESLYLNGRLGQFYGTELAPDAQFQKVSFQPDQRAGVLSHPYLMTGFAYHSTSSPIHRGVFVARSILGRFLKPPPEAFTPLPPDLHPDLTTRERVNLQTSSASCQSCHAMINPLGFSLEQFDAIGRYRNEEKGRPIDAKGSYRTRSGDLVEFTGVRELATFLANSEEVHESFVEQLFSYMIKQPIRAFGSGQLDELQGSFTQNNFSVRRLLAEMAVSSALKATELHAQKDPATQTTTPVAAQTPPAG